MDTIVNGVSVRFTYEKERLLASRQGFSEHNDCTVVALALAANMHYDETHRLLQDAGRRNRCRWHLFGWLKNNKQFYGTDTVFGDYKAVRVRLREPSITLAKFLRDFPRGRFLLHKRGHAFAVIDGQVKNLSSGARTRITEIFHFEKET